MTKIVHTPAPSLSAEEVYLMGTLAMAFGAVAKELENVPGTDRILIAMSMGLAAMQILKRAAPNDGVAMRGAEIFAQCSLRSMADMISGADSHQVTQ